MLLIKSLIKIMPLFMKLTLKKPIYVGVAVLELSKWLMYHSFIKR